MRFSVQGMGSTSADILSAAKPRWADFHKPERQRARTSGAVGRGKMSRAAALASHRQRIAGVAALRPRPRADHERRLRVGLSSRAPFLYPDLIDSRPYTGK